MTDYSAAAAGLFNNMRVPATLLVGATVAVGNVNTPLSKQDSPRAARAKQIHHLITTFAICCDLLSIIWSTIVVNKITEFPPAPAKSVVHLLMRDYELSWIGCNVNFFMGLFGFAACLVSSALQAWGPVKWAGASMISSAICLMLSVTNRGIAQGDGDMRFGRNMSGLVFRYFVLLLQHCKSDWGLLEMLSIALAVVSVVLAVGALRVTPQKCRGGSRRRSAEGDMIGKPRRPVRAT